MSTPWNEQYKHPLWQKKRLEALNAAQFRCSACDDDQKQLHVHHKRYVKGRKIWDYTVHELEVMCDECHEQAHHTKQRMGEFFVAIPSLYHEELLAMMAGFSVGLYFFDAQIEPGALEEMRQLSPQCFHGGVLAAMYYNCAHPQDRLDMTRKVMGQIRQPDQITIHAEAGIDELKEMGRGMNAPDLPAPMMPLDADLTGYEFMPLHGERLRTSSHNTSCSDAEFRASINLWWSAWLQVPAASLPSDERELCRLADLGRDMKAWVKVRGVAMRNFVLCSDGRYYHTFLAPLALEAWQARVKHRARGAKGAQARWLKQGNG